MTKIWTSRTGTPFAASKAMFSRWNDLPYGRWRTASGREVLVNRFYEPIWQAEDGVITEADPDEWVKDIVSQTWFYGDCDNPAATRKAKQALADWRAAQTGAPR